MQPNIIAATRAEVRPIAELEMLPGNPRRGDVEAIKRSLGRFGLRYPIVVRGDVVIAGNHRLQAAIELGWTEIATVDAGDLTDEEAKAFAVADNRTSDLADFDDEALAAMLAELSDADLQLAAGYDADALAAMLADVEPPNFDPVGDDDQPRLDQRAPTQCPNCSFEWRVGPRGEIEPV